MPAMRRSGHPYGVVGVEPIKYGERSLTHPRADR